MVESGEARDQLSTLNFLALDRVPSDERHGAGVQGIEQARCILLPRPAFCHGI
jgi:hypothetical protein